MAPRPVITGIAVMLACAKVHRKSHVCSFACDPMRKKSSEGSGALAWVMLLLLLVNEMTFLLVQ